MTSATPVAAAPLNNTPANRAGAPASRLELVRGGAALAVPAPETTVTSSPEHIEQTEHTPHPATDAPAPRAAHRAAPGTSHEPPGPRWLEQLRARTSVDRAPAPEPAPVGPSRSAPPAARADLLDVSGAEGQLDRWALLLGAFDAGPVSILEQAVPLAVSDALVRIGYESNSFYARKVSAPEVQDAVRRAAVRAFGLSAPPTFELVTGALPDGAPSIAARKESARVAERAARVEAARTHPLVARFLQLVGGEVRKVELPGDGPS
jgi:hypothetical protein